jgi:Fur family peroxide stress response transcriptional regulator
VENTDLKVLLKENKLKATKTRLAIYNYLKTNYTHPSIFDIYNNVKKKLPGISYATVYNVVNLFVNKGVIKELSTFENKKRYDGNTSDHVHLICVKCGKIEDVPFDFSQLKNLVKTQGWEIKETSLNIYGLCKDCNSEDIYYKRVKTKK